MAELAWKGCAECRGRRGGEAGTTSYALSEGKITYLKTSFS
jgi:hypothetical protein